MIHATNKYGFDADVIIAGAGPAGAAAACHLARSGTAVILLDRVSIPRDKVCGDFVGPSALVELGDLGVSQMGGYAQTNVGCRAAVYLNGKELISQRFPTIEGVPPYGRGIPRLVLDRLVVDAARRAGARVMDGFPLADFAIDSNAVVVDTVGPNGRFTL